MGFLPKLPKITKPKCPRGKPGAGCQLGGQMSPWGRRSPFPVHQALLHPPPAFPRLWVMLQSLGCEGMFRQTTELCKPSRPPAGLCCDIPRSQGRRGSALGRLETTGKQMGCEEGGEKNPSQQTREKAKPGFSYRGSHQSLPATLGGSLVRLIWWKIQLKLGHKKVISIQESTL